MRRNTTTPREPVRLPQREGPPLQRWARTLLRRPIRLLWPVDLAGSDHLPTTGAAIVCPNHLSFFDSVFMMLTFERPVYFIGKSEYLNSWTTRHLFPALGMIPIDRDCGARAMIALDAAAAVLQQGAVLCIYPEGTRSRDGRLHRGYTGAARLAAAIGCPLVPVGIRGTAELQPPGARLPRPRRRSSISVGAPLHFDRADGPARGAARATTDQLMQRIAELSGQEYVAHYSPRPRPAVVADREHGTRMPAVAPALQLGLAR